MKEKIYSEEYKKIAIDFKKLFTLWESDNKSNQELVLKLLPNYTKHPTFSNLIKYLNVTKNNKKINTEDFNNVMSKYLMHVKNNVKKIKLT